MRRVEYAGPRPLALVGKTWNPAMRARLQAAGIGEVVQPGEGAPSRSPWVLDNGAYRAWSRKQAPDPGPWQRALARAAAPPLFTVCPDLVGGGAASLAYSLQHRELAGDVPLLLAVQDAMPEADVRAALDAELFAGLFIGGATLTWKLTTMRRWREVAGDLWLHVGRASSVDVLRAAVTLGADSLDSSQPLWSFDHLGRFERALRDLRAQQTMF